MPVTLNVPTVSGVACAAPSFCEAVGQGGGGPPIAGKGSPHVGDGALVENWDGRAWLLQHAPGVDLGSLDAVSCPSPTFCEAIGSASPGVAAVETWNGNRWSSGQVRLPTNTNSLKLPAELSVISCATDKDCLATGVTMGAYVESWDGEGWRSIRLPTSLELVLFGVSCPDASFCEVVGEVVGTGRGATLAPVAEAWDGTSWHDQPMPGT